MKRLSLLLLFLGIANACCAQQQSVQTERPKPKPAAPVPRDALQPYYDQITNDLVNWFKQLKALAVERGTYSPKKLLPIINEAQETLKQTDWQKVWQQGKQTLKYAMMPTYGNPELGLKKVDLHQIDLFPPSSLQELLLIGGGFMADPSGLFECPQGLDDKSKKIVAQAKADINEELKKGSTITLTPEHWQQYEEKLKQYTVSEPKTPEFDRINKQLTGLIDSLRKVAFLPDQQEAKIMQIFATISASILEHAYKIAQMKGDKEAQSIISDVKTLSTEYAKFSAENIKRLQTQSEEFRTMQFSSLMQDVGAKINDLRGKAEESSIFKALNPESEKTVTIDLEKLQKDVHDYAQKLETIANDFCKKQKKVMQMKKLSEELQNYIAVQIKLEIMLEENRFVELAQAFMQLIPLDDWKQIAQNALKQIRDIVQESEVTAQISTEKEKKE